MPIEMVRIDDRLIHGQVMVGWCPRIKPDRIVVCDDEVACSEWECELYRSAADEYATTFCTVEQAADFLRSETAEQERLFVLVRSPKTVLELLNRGVRLHKVIVGGMHYKPGRRQLTPFIFVDEADIRHLREIAARGVDIEGRDVPSCVPINLQPLLNEPAKS